MLLYTWKKFCKPISLLAVLDQHPKTSVLKWKEGGGVIRGFQPQSTVLMLHFLNGMYGVIFVFCWRVKTIPLFNQLLYSKNVRSSLSTSQHFTPLSIASLVLLSFQNYQLAGKTQFAKIRVFLNSVYEDVSQIKDISFTQLLSYNLSGKTLVVVVVGLRL